MHGQIVAHIHRLRRYALLLCRNPDDADDLVQETLERAVARAETFRAGGDLRVWLFAILHNRYVSGRRAYARRREVGAACDAWSFDARSWDARSWDARSWDARSGNDRADIPAVGTQDSRDELQSVLTLVDRLPEAQRQVLLLVAVDGLGTDQVAAILDLPVGTVRSRLARGRETLRRQTEATPAEAAPAAVMPLKVVGGRDER